MDNKNLGAASRLTRSFLTACGIKISSILKTSYIVGSHAAFFSASSIAMPLMGAWSSIPTVLITFSFGFLIRLALGASFLPMFSYWIPGFCAALYWQLPSKIYRIGLPLVCMILFLAHPVGLAAAPYAFYWFIPMALAFMRNRSLWLDALASTFTAHAVGSVIWLYALPMTPAIWLSLIPIVACERLLYTAGIVAGHSVIAWCISLRSRVYRSLPVFRHS